MYISIDGLSIYEPNKQDCWVVDIKKWFKRWGVDDLLELSSDAMKYANIKERVMEPQTKKWEDATRTTLEFYITNVNPKCWFYYKVRMPIDSIQPYLDTNTPSSMVIQARYDSCIMASESTKYKGI